MHGLKPRTELERLTLLAQEFIDSASKCRIGKDLRQPLLWGGLKNGPRTLRQLP